MYKILPAQEKHFDLIIPLLFETGYYEFGAIDNKLGLNAADLYKNVFLKPYLQYINIIANDDIENEIAGFFITTTKSQMEEIEQHSTNWCRDDPNLQSFMKNLQTFYLDATSDRDLFAHNAAIHPAHRGKGLYRKILEYRRKLAAENNCSRIILLVWESNPAHLIFKTCGIQYVGKLDCPEPLIQDTLLKGVWQL